MDLSVSGCIGFPAQEHKLDALVEYNSLKVAEKHLGELAGQLGEMVAADPPIPVAECIVFCKARKDEWSLPDAEIIKVRCLPLYGRNPGILERSLILMSLTQASLK